MKHQIRTALFALMLFLPAFSSRAETAPSLTPAPIDTLALYKNGTALVIRRVEPPANGSPVLLDGLFAPAHGTFWTDSPSPLSFLAAHRTVTLPPGHPAYPAPTQAAGEATVWVRIPGAVAESLQTAASADTASHVFLSDPAGDHLVDIPLRGTILPVDLFAGQNATPARIPGYAAPAAIPMTLRLDNGTTVSIPRAAVAGVVAQGAPRAETDAIVSLPVLEVAGATAPFRFSYLTSGAAWAPSYRISLLPSDSDALTARIEMAAEIRNELEDLSGVRLFLVSGYPNIESASVPSLLASGNTLPAFLDALSTPPSERNRGRGWNSQRPMMSQAGWTANFVAATDEVRIPAPLPDVLPENAASDIHYRAAGSLTLAKGATLRLPLGTADAPVERFVEWEPGWKYDEYGRRQKDDLEEQRVPWDALRFRNPFDAPLTTGPAFVFDASKPLLADGEPAADRPLGQTTLLWTNPGQEATLRVTKALSVATTFDETIPGRIEDYPTVPWDNMGTRFRRVEVETAVTAVNHRSDPVTLVIRPTVVGEYQSASIPPDSVQTEGSREARNGNGDRPPNPTQKLRWSVPLAPGETLSLTYRYTTLVRL